MINSYNEKLERERGSITSQIQTSLSAYKILQICLPKNQNPEMLHLSSQLHFTTCATTGRPST